MPDVGLFISVTSMSSASALTSVPYLDFAPDKSIRPRLPGSVPGSPTIALAPSVLAVRFLVAAGVETLHVPDVETIFRPSLHIFQHLTLIRQAFQSVGAEIDLQAGCRALYSGWKQEQQRKTIARRPLLRVR